MTPDELERLVNRARKATTIEEISALSAEILPLRATDPWPARHIFEAIALRWQEIEASRHARGNG